MVKADSDTPRECGSCGGSLVSFPESRLEDGDCPLCHDPIEPDAE